MQAIRQKLKKEEGATLVEILAAITILSIVVTAFLAFFVQAGRTNNMTTEVNEATFLAQEEIERMIHFSETGSDEFKEREKNEGPYTIETKIEENTINNTDEDSNEDKIRMNQVIVTVKEGVETRASMETWLPLQEDENTENQE